MDNMQTSSPFNGKLPPPRVAPTFAAQGFESVRVEEFPQRQEQARTEPDIGPYMPAPEGDQEEQEHRYESDIVDDPTFTYQGYQVVRGEYFSHINEPSITFCDNRFSVNSACLKKMANIEFVQVLVNQEQRKLVVRPCSEDVKDSFSWCSVRRKCKKVVCPLFCGKIMTLMGWNPDHRYKIIGKLVHSQGQYLFVFDLNSPEIYRRTLQIDENGNEKRRTARKPTYLDEWKDHFGLPVEEHQKSLQISMFDGYALIGVKESKNHSTQKNEDVGVTERESK